MANEHTERRIPLVDLKRQYQSIHRDIETVLSQVMDEQVFVGGRRVLQFEEAFLRISGLPHGMGCGSGTAALSLALEALGVGDGDEVIIPSHTFFATAEAVVQVGAKPVLADIEQSTYTIDPESVERLLTPSVAALLPVHLYGTPARMDELMDLAASRDLLLIEDCAQAHLGRYGVRPVGSLGDAGAFSFYPGKNLGAFGDAGFLSSRSLQVVETARRLADHGRSDKYVHQVVGYNHRLDTIQAVVLEAKSRFLAKWTEARRSLAALYDSILIPRGFKVVESDDTRRSVYHLYVVEVSNRTTVIESLSRHGISTGIHYPVPLHRQPGLKGLCRIGDVRVTDSIVTRILTLPLFPELTEKEVRYICEVFLEVAEP